jgi:hypothetical protein
VQPFFSSVSGADSYLGGGGGVRRADADGTCERPFISTGDWKLQHDERTDSTAFALEGMYRDLSKESIASIFRIVVLAHSLTGHQTL